MASVKNTEKQTKKANSVITDEVVTFNRRRQGLDGSNDLFLKRRLEKNDNIVDRQEDDGDNDDDNDDTGDDNDDDDDDDNNNNDNDNGNNIGNNDIHDDKSDHGDSVNDDYNNDDSDDNQTWTEFSCLISGRS